MRVAVFGATGVQGAAQISALASASHHSIAVTRRSVDPTTTLKSSDADGSGADAAARAALAAAAETRTADFTSVETLPATLAGADAVFLNLPSFQPREPLVAAAKAIGEEAAAQAATVKLVVFNTSFPVPEKDAGIEAQETRREMRRVLREATKGSGVAVVSLQPVVYLDNLLEGWALPRLRDEGRIVYCHKPDLEVSWICHDDLAALMVAALERDPKELDGRDIPVGGPETVRLSQLAEKLGRAWGREVGHENQSVDDFAGEMAAALKGALESQAGKEVETVVEETRKAYTWYNEAEEKPFKVDMGPVLKEFPAKLTPIEEWGKRKGCPIKTK
ncbi:hypothetical protein K4K61_001422 [Colletotrichum sp. SAR11_59]|nr:hypothetical protein K4K61_001422 [Colletotrichum sp. SAR11_59]